MQYILWLVCVRAWFKSFCLRTALWRHADDGEPHAWRARVWVQPVPRNGTNIFARNGVYGMKPPCTNSVLNDAPDRMFVAQALHNRLLVNLRVVHVFESVFRDAGNKRVRSQHRSPGGSVTVATPWRCTRPQPQQKCLDMQKLLVQAWPKMHTSLDNAIQFVFIVAALLHSSQKSAQFCTPFHSTPLSFVQANR